MDVDRLVPWSGAFTGAVSMLLACTAQPVGGCEQNQTCAESRTTVEATVAEDDASDAFSGSTAHPSNATSDNSDQNSQTESSDVDQTSAESTEEEDDGTGGMTKIGHCGFYIEGKASKTYFSGEFNFYLRPMLEQVELCRVRVPFERVAEADTNCEFLSSDCDWSHKIQYSSAIIDHAVGTACDDRIALWGFDPVTELPDTQIDLGFHPEGGHEQILLQYNREEQVWEVFSIADWDEQSSLLTGERALQWCEYVLD